MTEEAPKRRRGRPRTNDAAGAPTLVKPGSGFHLGLRLTAERGDQIKRLVALANERARLANIPAQVTSSSLVTMWIIERVQAEIDRLDKKRSAK